MSPKSVGVAMSGGVDSTASALILSRDHHVRGFFMDLGQPDVDITKSRVQNLATSIGIDLEIIDLKDVFKQRVLSYFSHH